MEQFITPFIMLATIYATLLVVTVKAHTLTALLVYKLPGLAIQISGIILLLAREGYLIKVGG
jgi:hypothetical protein